MSDEQTPASAQLAGNEAIDASLRLPVLLFIGAAIFWLLKASGWGLVNAYQTTNSEFLANLEWFTYGRMNAAAQTGFIYGWCLNAAFAAGLWIMARLTRVPVASTGLLITGGILWNLGVFAAIFGIFFMGDFGNHTWLRMPDFGAPVLLAAYTMIGAWGVHAFGKSRIPYSFASQWYILGALFWLPWLLTIATVMLGCMPLRGVVQAITGTWYAGCLGALILTPFAVGTAYYVVPKVLNRSVSNYYLSILGFWTLAAFGGWIGPSLLIGGPVPIWLQAMGTVSSMLIIIPVIIISFNLHGTIGGEFSNVFKHPELRFIAFGMLMFSLLGLVLLLSGLRGFSAVTQYTWFRSGMAYHLLYGFYSMVMFGALTYIIPRVLGLEWPDGTMSATLFRGSALATLVGVTALYYAGWQQGVMAAAVDADGASLYTWAEITAASRMPVLGKAVALLLASIGHFAFAINFALLLFNYLRQQATRLELIPATRAQEA